MEWASSHLPFVEEVVNESRNSNEVNLFLKFKKGFLPSSLPSRPKLERDLKLTSKFSTSNIHLFLDGKLSLFTPEDVIRLHYERRLSLYEKRKSHQLISLDREASKAQSKALFVRSVKDRSVDPTSLSKSSLVSYFRSNLYFSEPAESKGEDSYSYLLNMKVSSFTTDEADRLEREALSLSRKHDSLLSTPVSSIWKDEIQDVLSCVHPSRKRKEC
jgi:hypothetical protein